MRADGANTRVAVSASVTNPAPKAAAATKFTCPRPILRASGPDTNATKLKVPAKATIAETRRAGVTAYFTSRMMDLGYTKEELTKENLMRMSGVEVTDRTAARLIEQRGERPTIDELVRDRISNQ